MSSKQYFLFSLYVATYSNICGSGAYPTRNITAAIIIKDSNQRLE